MECKNNDVKAHGCRTSSELVVLLNYISFFFLASTIKFFIIKGNLEKAWRVYSLYSYTTTQWTFMYVMPVFKQSCKTRATCSYTMHVVI